MLRIDHLIALARTASNLSAWCADTTHDIISGYAPPDAGQRPAHPENNVG